MDLPVPGSVVLWSRGAQQGGMGGWDYALLSGALF